VALFYGSRRIWVACFFGWRCIWVARLLWLTVYMRVVICRSRSTRTWRSRCVTCVRESPASISVVTSRVSATTVGRAGRWITAQTRPRATTNHSCVTTSPPWRRRRTACSRPLRWCKRQFILLWTTSTCVVYVWLSRSWYPSPLSRLNTVERGWPLVWKTWKCQGIWQLSGKCQILLKIREISGKKSCQGKVA